MEAREIIPATTLGGGRIFNPPKGKHMLKRAESHPCEVNKLGILACNFNTFFKVSQRDFFKKIAYRI